MSTASEAEKAIAAIESFGGALPGYRRGHARGLVCQADFEAASEARTLTRAEHFQGGSIPCQVRFSNAAANPCAPDRQSATRGQVVGLAVRFDLPSGQTATWAAVNLTVFPAHTPQEFIDLTRAQGSGHNGKPNLLRVLWHILRHLHILAGIKSVQSLKPAVSFAAETYHGLHTYFFVNAAGARRPFRYRWAPRIPHATLDPNQARARPKLYLLDEIRARLAQGPVVWDLLAQFPEPGDPLDDASLQWPETRTLTRLGSLAVRRVFEDQRSSENLVFDPTGVVPGIELSDDPLLRFRSAVYGLSYERRSRESRRDPAPEDMGQ